MASISRSRRTLEARSGGKIVRPRRAGGASARTTPYERPRFANPPAENSNWLSKLILSPTRAVVSGAGMLISSVFGPEESSSSSSSSSGDTDDDDDYISTQEDEGLNKNGASEKINFFRMVRPTTIVESGNKHVIEQMLMQETFSREECERLIKVIKSRVVGFTTSEDAENTRPNVDTPDLCVAAVTEAKKWLKEKRSGSTSKSYADIGTGNLSSLMSSQGAEDEGGSPADVAKSYMRARPAGASPSIKYEELRSPSSTGRKLFNEGTPYSITGTSMSKSKLKRNTPATGSWNIQEELRRVRSKASEELLMSLPSTRIDWSGSTLGDESTLGSSLPDGNRKNEMEDIDKNTENAVGANVNLSVGITMPCGSEVLEKTQYGLQKEALPIPAIISSEQNQDADVASIDGKEGASGSQTAVEHMLSSGQRHEAIEDMKTAPPSDASLSDFDGRKYTNVSEQENPLVEGTIEVADFVLHDIASVTAEVTGSRTTYTTNGSPSTFAFMSAELGIEENGRLNGEIDLVSSSHENIAVDETLDFASEFVDEGATIEVSKKNESDVGDTMESDFVAGGSQDSSSMPEEPSQELTQPKSKRTAVAKTSAVAEKPKGARVTKYNRRGRPRRGK